jgi:hypothetical protein
VTRWTSWAKRLPPAGNSSNDGSSGAETIPARVPTRRQAVGKDIAGGLQKWKIADIVAFRSAQRRTLAERLRKNGDCSCAMLNLGKDAAAANHRHTTRARAEAWAWWACELSNLASSAGQAWLPAGFHRKVARCILHSILVFQVQRSARTVPIFHCLSAS